jgi:hypothetical protein
MGKLRDEALSKQTEDTQSHELTSQEMNYLKLLNMTLQFHTHAQKLVSGYLYYICTGRLGYENGVDLRFELDFDKDDNMLTVTVLPPAPIGA